MVGTDPLRGLIPAHAGKTDALAQPGSPVEAHPRSRGENRSCTVTRWAAAGSSPLTRGKRARLVAAMKSPRLIPAHAGKTRRQARPITSLRAHPRSRGENLIGYSITQKHLGSSPLTRGKHLCADAVAWNQGLIPAHAGKT